MLDFFHILSLVATPLIAASVAIVAWRQWVTSQHELMLNLFEKRLSVYSDANRAVAVYLGTNDLAELADALNRIYAVADRSCFLFGGEVENCLREAIQHMEQMEKAARVLACRPDIEQKIDEESEARRNLGQFRARFRVLLLPYMRMDQRLPGVASPSDDI